MKRFLKEAGGVDQYSDVTIKWIRHHNPDLEVFVDGRKTQTIDLSGYSTSGLHELFSRHFVRRGAARAGRSLGEDSNANSSAVPVVSSPTAVTATTTATTSPAISSADSANGGAIASATPPTPSLRSHDAALPKPVWRQAADTPFAASPLVSDATAPFTGPLTAPANLALVVISVLTLAMLARCILRQRQRPKAKADGDAV